AGLERFADERAADPYDGANFRGSLQFRLGRSAVAASWLGFEGQYRENDLDEDRYYVRMFLTLPF
ncbi:MAG TPA: hypothetical protein VIL97_06250, partial [Thermoanaerobaculia bacterium]